MLTNKHRECNQGLVLCPPLGRFFTGEFTGPAPLLPLGADEEGGGISSGCWETVVADGINGGGGIESNARTGSMLMFGCSV